MARQIILDDYDEVLAELVRALMEVSVKRAHRPSGVAKRIAMKGTAPRNRAWP